MSTIFHRYSQRITGAELPRSGRLRPILIRSYTIQKKGKEDYQVVLQGDNPFVEIDWPEDKKTITPEMAEVLGAESNTYVYTDLIFSKYEGLRKLRWNFWIRGGKPELDLGWEPWLRYPYEGALLGSVFERDDYLKIPGIGYYLRPEVALRGGWDLGEIRLYSQREGLVHLLSPDVNRVVKFTHPKKPDKKWVRSEVERFKKNGVNLKEKQVKEMYVRLRNHLRSFSVISGEILAYPLLV